MRHRACSAFFIFTERSIDHGPRNLGRDFLSAGKLFGTQFLKQSRNPLKGGITTEKKQFHSINSNQKSKRRNKTMKTNKENDKNQNKIIKDVPRFENDIYRISSWTGKEGASFLDIHVFYKKDGKFKKTKEGMNIRAGFRHEVAKALLAAKNAPEMPLPAEGKNFEVELMTSVALSETEEYQVSKVRGPKNSFVRIGYAFKGEKGEFIPSGKKALSILEPSVDGVVEALRSPEAEPAQAVTQAA